MADVKTLDQGSKILQNVDVSSIVTGLALGIAEAQERLDNNSISQLIRLADTKVAGRSLLEFGFQPAFYAFDYADVSASIQLKMAIKEELEVDFSLSVDYKSNTTFDKGFFDQLKKNKSKSTSKYSKTQKTVALEAKTSKNVSVNEQSFVIHEEEGSVSKISSSEEEMRDASEELRVESVVVSKEELTNHTSSDVYIREENGYIVITNPIEHTKVKGLLKMDQQYSATAKAIRIKGGTSVTPSSLFNKITDFNTTVTNATSANNDNSPTTAGEVIGINENGIRKGSTTTPFAFYFDWDIDAIDEDYTYNQSNPSLTLADMEVLAFVLKESNLKVTIKGYTDGSGSDSEQNSKYNELLGKKRAEALKSTLQGFAGQALTNVTTETFGEQLATNSDKLAELRKVTIEFDPTTLFDFIYFHGGHITSAATVSAPEEYLYLEATNPTVNKDVIFTYGNSVYTLVDIANTIDRFSALTNNKGKIDEFYVEKYNQSYYLLHEESKVNYFLHSKDNKEIEVKIENKASAEVDKSKTDIYVSETQNDTSKLKESAKDFEGDRSLAISGSLDVRYARQFGMSVEGNASVSARMVSVPPPTGLENYIATLTGNATSTTTGTNSNP